jgi:hypothetical protein
MASYYSTQLSREFTSVQVRDIFGFNPDTYNIDILNDRYNLFPVNPIPVPVYDTNLYSGYTASWAPNADGNTYDKSFAFIERPLADAQANVIAKLKDIAEIDSIEALGGVAVRIEEGEAINPDFNPGGPYKQVGGESATIFTAQSYLAAASRLEPYKSIGTSINAIATALDSKITAVNAAISIDEVKVIYRPVSGTLEVTRSGNNLVSGIFTDLQNASTLEMSLVLLASGYVSYYDETNGFTALGGELGAGTASVELYAGSSLVATLVIPDGNATTSIIFP